MSLREVIACALSQELFLTQKSKYTNVCCLAMVCYFLIF